MSGTITADYDELKRMAAEFVKAIPALDMDELDNGLKCFHLAWLNMEPKRKPDEVMARGLLYYVMAHYNERERSLIWAAREVKG